METEYLHKRDGKRWKEYHETRLCAMSRSAKEQAAQQQIHPLFRRWFANVWFFLSNQILEQDRCSIRQAVAVPSSSSLQFSVLKWAKQGFFYRHFVDLESKDRQ